MKDKSIKINFLFNILKICTELIFPIITFPYISRVLTPEGVGKINFTNSLISYFLILTSLGIPLYGIREIGKVRNDKEKLNKTLSEIFFLNLITTILTGILFYMFLKLNLLGKEIKLLQIMSLNIFLNFLGVEWFYQGIEEYKYITLRSIIFKIISLILIFIFVKEKNDYIYYGAITIFATVGSNILNFINLKKFIKLQLKNLNIKKHFKPILTIFSMNLAISIYTNLDSIMLGYRSSETAVGLYSAPFKLVRLILGLVTALGAVMLPRISNYIANKKEEELKLMLENAFSFLIFLSIPCSVGLYLISSEIILIFSGQGFKESIVTMKLLTPIICFIAFSNFLGIQILYPRGKEKRVLISVIIGAVINFGFNWILIPKYAQNGAAFSTTLAEGVVVSTQIVLGYKYLNFKIFNKDNFKFIISSFFMIMGILIIEKFNIENIYLRLFNKISWGIIIYIVSLLLMKQKMIYEFFIKIFERRKNAKI